MTRRLRTSSLLLLAAVALVAAACGSSGAGSATTTISGGGDMGLVAPTTDGGQLAFGDLDGAPALVWFWAPW